jgi:hypothetical protein
LPLAALGIDIIMVVQGPALPAANVKSRVCIKNVGTTSVKRNVPIVISAKRKSAPNASKEKNAINV